MRQPLGRAREDVPTAENPPAYAIPRHGVGMATKKVTITLDDPLAEALASAAEEEGTPLPGLSPERLNENCGCVPGGP
ncbi:hypothetical protein GCM10023079_35260 [Streptomyces chitinivorans]